ncbi:uridine diphosphate-N-acetylglucosamine-binding protein YvcK [Actinomyces sp. zg-332]|uniref:gluconeogenesis factor YvcK family protein n=1 Tax=Actinomyces sp. zg-332 TaxID=2708340 RepID=UPI0014225D9D|nr:uridine diphosphate-N-acetylglucosamine-binding protein YvcK [Actinomyces sp. zg-332]QPK93759.1 uridine diphosphate-N-acetylglucosamine-binding protein YvcK [Actinomyces sp. zg-332]
MYDYRFEPKVVALGGGHGLFATLQALKHITRNLTAVVTVGDDGGSSGRIREQIPVLPPGDLRMALTAMCDDTDWGNTWSKVLQHRFTSSGDLNEHSVGNLLITALWQLFDDPVIGLEWVGKLLDANGRVLPAANEPVDISGKAYIDGEYRFIKGQANMAKAWGNFVDVKICPENPVVSDEVVKVISEADWLVLGPGSWYTSVIPHLLIPKLRDALIESKAKCVLNMNLISNTAETTGMSIVDHVKEFVKYAPNFQIDIIIADPSSCEDTDDLYNIASEYGAKVMLRSVHSSRNKALHDSLRLASALRDAFEGFYDG